MPCVLKSQRCGGVPLPSLVPPAVTTAFSPHRHPSRRVALWQFGCVLGDAGLTHLTKMSDSAPSAICGVCWERGGWLLFWDTVRDRLKSLVGALVDVTSLLKSAHQQQGSFSGGLLRTKSKILTLGPHLGHCACLRLHFTSVHTPRRSHPCWFVVWWGRGGDGGMVHGALCTQEL